MTTSYTNGPNGTRCHTCELWDKRSQLTLAVDALRSVLGRTIEMRVDLATGKPYEFLGEERREALALAGEVMKGVRR